jgi:hypothetical protein
MRFVNDTPLEAAMVPTCEAQGDAVTALFLCAVTYRVDDGILALAPAQRPLLLAPGLPYPNDAMFFKTGVSVCATGFVYPREREGRQAVASLRVGAAEVAIAAFGPRVWEQSLGSGALTPSRPLPFERVAMTWKNAFGGIVEEPASVLQVDGEEAFLPAHENGYPFNFDGTGFYTDARSALHQPLPQLEHPEQLVQRWDDRPEPVSFAPCPLWSGLRAQFVMRDRQLDTTRINRIPNRSAPRTTFERLDAGTEITLSGMRPGGAALSFVVPPSPVTVDLSVGGRAEQAVLALDAVDIDAEDAEVRLLYRAAVTYGLVQFELRRATLQMVADFPEA